MDKELPVSVWQEWKIIEKIGEGSFGKVYKAQRSEQGKTFYSAIKILTIPSSQSELNSVRLETADEQSIREYFHGLMEECIQEVSTMEYFRGNSHVVSVEDFKVMEYLDEIGWEIYIRMEYLTSFLDYCMGKNLSEDEVIQLGIDLCKALEHCRQLNIIHRDIKPENIFVSRFGEFKIGDFGIARELERTMSGLSKKGTYSYMAPEMYRGEQYDARVDIYSLGIVLYKLMNHNRLPFLNLEKQLITYRDKENALTRRMSGEQLPKPADAGDGFSQIILKACAYNPQERYQEPGEFRRDLEDLKRGIFMSGGNGQPESSGAGNTGRAGHNISGCQSAAAAPGQPGGRGKSQPVSTAGNPNQSGRYEGLQNASTAGRQSEPGRYEGLQNAGNAGRQSEPGRYGELQNGSTAGRQGEPGRYGELQDGSTTGRQNDPGRYEEPWDNSTAEHQQGQSVEYQPGDYMEEAIKTARQTLAEERYGSPRKSAGKKRRRKKKKPSPLLIAVIVVALCTCLMAGVYIKLLLEEPAEEEPQDLVDMLTSDQYQPDASSPEDFSKAIDEIRQHATTITDNLSNYDWIGEEGDKICYYDRVDSTTYQLMKVLVYPQSSEDGLYEEYYYWEGELFFAYIWEDDKTADLYYYKNGTLIRWIDAGKVVHDNETDNEEYVERGEKYWTKALEQLEAADSGTEG